ncbi:GatB/YqeY domain-containing protein [Streptacidiphilus fuscans]|uniref:GatB/YqeY domain-containing protein n=1 Tax=Streptacidiphilus fuscans TaxID=2789292 RepID=A0A931FF68_9ACTN|nr:GatB/YqeY domain-containing protein [Streptacidiphilus fuscans]MBF9068134.1 GatB/YqeY domain-containing protein [Streptacidiphilus fuscans]
MTTNETVVPIRQRLRDALTVALKGRDRVAASVLRATLGAIENAEAVERPEPGRAEGERPGSLAIEATPLGVGAAEVDRRVLTEADVRAIVRAEVAEREAAVEACERAGRGEQAERLRAELNVLVAFGD